MPRFALILSLFALSLTAAPVPGSTQSDNLTSEPSMAAELNALLTQLNLDTEVRSHRLAVSLVDVTDAEHPRYAGVNDTSMMYAASLPKICILLAGLEKVRAGQLRYNQELREMFTRIARYSSNTDASKAVQIIGFKWIEAVLTSSKYRFYDPSLNGGLWLGKAYGGPNDVWRRDPLHNLSHGATTLQIARFYTMLAQEKLVDPEMSRELKEILSKPGINHKFVKGLSGTPGAIIYRKSGSWKQWHADSALIEHNGRRYVAAALVDNENGDAILQNLIRGLDAIVCNSTRAAAN